MITKDEQDILDSISNTSIGREGLVTDRILTERGQNALESLIKKKLIIKIKGNPLIAAMDIKTYGLPNRRYPETLRELREYRDSGHSKEISYEEYLDIKINEHGE